MKLWLKNNWKLLLFFIIIIGFRVWLTFLPAHSDVRIQAEWGKWMYLNNKTVGLYNWNVWECIWPNHPPLISWLYYMAYIIHSFLMMFMSTLGNFIAFNRLAPTKFLWFFDFIIWFGTSKYETTNFLNGVITVIKQYMVLADFLIAGVIYWLCKKFKSSWKKYVFIYLLLPFSWYLSAIWGQSDQLSFLFLIISFILLSTKRSIWSPLFYAIALNLKPDCVILFPLYLFIWYKQKQSLKNLFFGGMLAVIFSLWTVTWFYEGNFWDFIFGILLKRLNTSDGLINLNSYNFWYLFYPFPNKIAFETTKYWLFSAKNWGFIVFGGLSILSLKLIKYKKIESTFISMFMVGFGGWLFMTGMHERYAFFGMVALLFYSIYKIKYLKYFIGLSIIFFLGMFYAFPTPATFDLVKIIFDWQGQTIPRLLSLINLILYIKIIFLFFKEKI
jgi:Gpi18-like mannosyltransferase